MIRELDLRLLPHIAGEPGDFKTAVARKAGVPEADIRHVEVMRRSIDARQRDVMIQLRVKIFIKEDHSPEETRPPEAGDVRLAREVVVVGMGPAGLFAAVELIRQGLKPILLERGKDVRERIADLKGINVRHEVNPDSNYCFGEGGAGTYSDGKLYTRSTKRGNVAEVLEWLVGFGAVRDILVDAHPHIGTNKLPGIIAAMRTWILAHGGEVRFNTRVTGFRLDGDRIVGLETTQGHVPAPKVILATGHSARDIFDLLHRSGIEIALKPLAIGVRVEHPQAAIDSIQYHCDVRGPYLPPSPYSIVKQVGGRGVYSFCMCPGGVIAPCATSPGEIVTNGWSSSRRARSTANSGIVVELRPEDFAPHASAGPLAAMAYQQAIEHAAWEAGGRTQTAPAQRLVDFVNGRASRDLPDTSYAPGITSVELTTVLPETIHRALVAGFRLFDRSMKGYLTNEAVVLAPETRTSSPVSIPRDPVSTEHIRIRGLHPCGEGAGYAGGIVSAAMDGIKVARQLATI
jgi:uncharacterized protein